MNALTEAGLSSSLQGAVAGNDPESDGTLKIDRSAKVEAALHLRIYCDASVVAHRLPEPGKIRIGRAATNDVVVDDVALSRQHAVLHVGARIEIEDLGSANGTTVRHRTLGVGERAVIEVGEPFELGTLSAVIKKSRAITLPGMEVERPANDAPSGSHAVFPTSGPMRDLRATIDRLAVGTISVLILGETGVGKEVISEQVHLASPRAARAYVRINCGALTESLLESELFGHEKGAFTGANQAKVGLLESANGGTVFLDEVGELPAGLQVKLLRVLENREVVRVGAVRPRPLDVRFIAATNRNLEQAVQESTFREDLFFRLSAATVQIPPLRERVDEIIPLANWFLGRSARELGRRVPALSNEARDTMLRYHWPGNIRELRNAIERAVLLCDDTVEARFLPTRLVGARIESAPQSAPRSSGAPRKLADELDEIERRRIVDALEQCAGSQSRAATVLGISRSTLLARIDHYQIPRPRKKHRDE
jgi:two-component system response regulator AtoC